MKVYVPLLFLFPFLILANFGKGVMESPNSEGKGLYIIPVHNLASDGEPVWPTPTPTPAPTATPVPVIADGGSVVDIISGYPWPVDQALRIAWCESRYDPDAYNPQAVWVGGQENHATGVFQLLWPLHSHRFSGASPYSAEANVRAAYGLWLERGWQPWIVGGCSP